MDGNGVEGEIVGELELDEEEVIEGFQYLDLEVERRTATSHSVPIDDLSISFPYEPYPSQIQMMEKILLGVKAGENCLLESPTGTGKTVALLCSLLAWIQKCKVSGPAYYRNIPPSPCTCDFDLPGSQITQEKSGRFGNEIILVRRLVEEELPVPAPAADQDHEEEMPSPKKSKVEVDPLLPRASRTLETACKACIRKYYYESTPPKIYYATRTHSQIQQVVKQLKETEYAAGLRMTILSSRGQTCINSEVRESASLEEECSKRVKTYWKETKQEAQDTDPRCPYYLPDFESKFSGVGRETGGGWDIEDIVQYGKRVCACPYFGAKALHASASIVFCSYNYLLYPHIRRASGVRLPNNILIFDEAHNIENIARDVGSVKFPAEKFLKRTLPQIDVILENELSGASSESFQTLRKFKSLLMDLRNWSLKHGKDISSMQTNVSGIKEGSRHLPAEKFMAEFKELGLGQEDVEELLGDLAFLEDKDTKPVIHREIISALRSLLFPLGQMYERGSMADYAAVILKRETVDRSSGLVVVSHEFRLTCLNPALAFEILQRSARSIIVTSGTLTPLNSYASELGTTFEQRLSARHALREEQIHAAIMSNPGQGHSWDFRLRSDVIGQPDFQRWLGEFLIGICETVPGGILVFLPSYATQGRLLGLWEKEPFGNTVLEQLGRLKVVFVERAGVRPEEFREMMDEYKRGVGVGGVGSLLLAICRGNVSEGVDFRDEEARAVVSVGIPHLPPYDPSIEAKRVYNDRRHRGGETGILTSWEWYLAQGYRAANQSLGRCIRHKNDWGVLILVDARWSEERNKEYLSEWVKDFLVDSHDPPEVFLGKVRAFIATKFQD